MEDHTWIYKIIADSSCGKNSYQHNRHIDATYSLAIGNVWDQCIWLQYTPADSREETLLDPLSCVGI
ncbi:hypothetical protein Y1Q_0004746 [Alligator mississippiensis]|uniref:Uncharacterized protein n=1 Tax=Alligator mississippiensis TaxID=8496 RepID=A0A151NLH5_ALLMI|nr:hypothetical protein Y1Q_0004746 [Alligator mississippiensis]